MHTGLLTKKQQALEEILKGFSCCVVAVSGGLDSRFLTHMCTRVRIPVHAVHIHGPHIAEHETHMAVQWLEKRDIPYSLLYVSPLDVPEVARNDTRRCYHCKKILFSAIQEHIVANPALSTKAVICDGSNRSDKEEYRPGQQALEELHIRSPLAEAEITKPELRSLAAFTGLEHPEQPSRPCLLTRFGYGNSPSLPTLAQVGACEAALLRAGLRAFRLRLPDAETTTLYIAEDESPLSPDMLATIKAVLNTHNFSHAAIRYTSSLTGVYDRQARLAR